MTFRVSFTCGTSRQVSETVAVDVRHRRFDVNSIIVFPSLNKLLDYWSIVTIFAFNVEIVIEEILKFCLHTKMSRCRQTSTTPSTCPTCIGRIKSSLVSGRRGSLPRRPSRKFSPPKCQSLNCCIVTNNINNVYVIIIIIIIVVDGFIWLTFCLL